MKKNRKKFNHRKKNEKRNNYKNLNPQKSNKEIKSVITNVKKNQNIEKTNDKGIITLSTTVSTNEEKKEKVIIDSKNLKSNQKIQIKKEKNIYLYKINTLSYQICSLCNKQIVNMSTAIFQKENNKYYHFECVTSEIRKRVILKPNQRISYMGSGIFAVIEDIKVDGKFKFSIKQRINFNK